MIKNIYKILFCYVYSQLEGYAVYADKELTKILYSEDFRDRRIRRAVKRVKVDEDGKEEVVDLEDSESATAPAPLEEDVEQEIGQ